MGFVVSNPVQGVLPSSGLVARTVVSFGEDTLCNASIFNHHFLYLNSPCTSRSCVTYFQNYTSLPLQFGKQGMHLVEHFPCKPEAVLCSFSCKIMTRALDPTGVNALEAANVAESTEHVF